MRGVGDVGGVISVVNRDILSLTRQAGFDELESEDIEDVLASHTEELTNEDLQLLTEHSPIEDDEEEIAQRTLTTKRKAEASPARYANPYR
ncbi:putative Tigger transposable element-derived protein 1-like 219 [Homarus americanus]|uniref:Putative Tigger transposable element-derived protein 1-like 219 n=1 Tax=Homarus americanus TaxID=6706 RepID=A0A8J5N9F9_HOMAM|nr:putative Tigger transposable element-derived protein 1-like 219 [Homarus americanus]